MFSSASQSSIVGTGYLLAKNSAVLEGGTWGSRVLTSKIMHRGSNKYETVHMAMSEAKWSQWDEDLLPAAPAQFPTSAANAPGSCLGFWRRSGDRAADAVS